MLQALVIRDSQPKKEGRKNTFMSRYKRHYRSKSHNIKTRSSNTLWHTDLARVGGSDQGDMNCDEVINCTWQYAGLLCCGCECRTRAMLVQL